MGDKTKIGWTLRTQNFWIGCRKVSPGCAKCYMFRDMERFGKDPKSIVRTKTWGAPLKWQKEAAATNSKQMVFTCSWSDFFIEEADEWRPDAWKVIKQCPNLIWQVLTKRPHLMPDRLPPDWGDGYPNVALGVSIESDAYNSRADELRKVPARWHFISAEPLLGSCKGINLDHIEWLIAGGESGSDFRPMNLDWARELRDVCLEKKIAFFYKQNSATLPGQDNVLDGRTWEEWPEGWL